MKVEGIFVEVCGQKGVVVGELARRPSHNTNNCRVTHTQTMVTQATDYGVWGDVLREMKAAEFTYRFGYQGQFAEKDDETGWNHFELREYDAIIGRWLIPDPYRQYWSPYLAMGNNPINRVDPDGGCDECPPFLPNGNQALWDESLRYAEQFASIGSPTWDKILFGWLEDFFPLEGGGGYAYFSSNGGGPAFKPRNGTADGFLHNPGEFPMFGKFWRNRPTSFPKGHIPTPKTPITGFKELIETSGSVNEAFDKVIQVYGSSKKAVEALTNKVNDSVHQGTNSARSDTLSWEVQLGEGRMYVRKHYKSYNDSTWVVREDTIRNRQ
jgi:RHS repeat-associated protein